MSKCDPNVVGDGVTKAPGIASFEGVLNGLGGLVGLGGFWDPADNTGLTNVSNEYAKQQSAITQKLDNMKGAIKKVEQEYWQNEIDAIVASNQFHQELEDDKIQKNTLLIQIIIVILLIIIIYLVVL